MSVDLKVLSLDGNNTDKSSSMFWTGIFTDCHEFELELRYGSVLLHHLNDGNIIQETVIGHTDDFPKVCEVLQIFATYLDIDISHLTKLKG